MRRPRDLADPDILFCAVRGADENSGDYAVPGIRAPLIDLTSIPILALRVVSLVVVVVVVLVFLWLEAVLMEYSW